MGEEGRWVFEWMIYEKGIAHLKASLQLSLFVVSLVKT